MHVANYIIYIIIHRPHVASLVYKVRLLSLDQVILKAAEIIQREKQADSQMMAHKKCYGIIRMHLGLATKTPEAYIRTSLT